MDSPDDSSPLDIASKWRDVLAAVPVEVFITDRDFEVLHQNPTSVEHRGQLARGTRLSGATLASRQEELKELVSGRTVELQMSAANGPETYRVRASDEGFLVWTATDGRTQPDHDQSPLDQSPLESAVINSQIGFWSWTPQDGKVWWSDRMHEIAQSDQPLDMSAWLEQRSPQRDPEKAQSFLKDPEGVFPPTATQITLPTGEKRWVLATGTLERDAEGTPQKIEGGLLDITDMLVEAEAAHQAEKNYAFRAVAAGIAHNFNNMLMIIEPCLEALDEVVPESHRSFVKDATEAGERSSAIVRDLMTVGNQNAEKERRIVPFEGLCRDAFEQARRDAPKSIRLEFLGNSPHAVWCCSRSVSQAILTLIQSACLGASESNTRPPEVSLCISDIAIGTTPWVQIIVRDNGLGMSKEMLGRVFNPFFSKEGRPGKGLGLALSEAIARQHGGRLTVESTEGHGTDFIFQLPVYDPASSGTEESGMTSNETPKARVLVVDDEPAICRVVNHTLKRNGFFSTSVSNPADIETALKENEPFDIILLDRSMGTTQGADLIPFLRQAAPGAKVLYFTGEFVEQDEVADVDGVVQKPLNGKQLTETLKKVL